MRKTNISANKTTYYTNTSHDLSTPSKYNNTHKNVSIMHIEMVTINNSIEYATPAQHLNTSHITCNKIPTIPREIKHAISI